MVFTTIPYRTNFHRTKLSKFRLRVKNFVRQKILSVENFLKNFNIIVKHKSDNIIEISAWCQILSDAFSLATPRHLQYSHWKNVWVTTITLEIFPNILYDVLYNFQSKSAKPYSSRAISWVYLTPLLLLKLQKLLTWNFGISSSLTMWYISKYLILWCVSYDGIKIKTI